MMYEDEDVMFYLVVYKDYDRAVWCLDNVRIGYPDARIVVDVDGDTDERWARLRDLHGVELHYGKRLFLLKEGGAIVKRMLERHTEDETHRRWMFRIDTDTEVRRRFRYLPMYDYFGHHYPWRDFIQGGCVGMTRNLCDRILLSGCLDNPELGTNPLLWQEKPNTAEGRVGRHGLVSLDWILHWAVKQVGQHGRNFPEVRSTWKNPIPKKADCAVAHPCKDIPVHRPI